MPAAIFAAAATVGAELIGAALSATAAASFSWSVVAAKAAFSAGLSLVAETLRDSPQQASSLSSDIAARKQLVRASDGPRRAIYGKARVSGNLVYVASGTDTNYVHFVIAIATHRCAGIDAYWLGDETVGALDGNGNCTEGRFANHVRIKTYLGDQITADADLAAECPDWGAKARPGKGLAYVYLRLKRSRNVFPQGIPTPRFDVRGKCDILDVRTGTHGYTTNAALCTLDYILWKYGMASDIAEVEQSSWIGAANICDEDVACPGGGAQKRYAINGTFTLDQGRAKILDGMRQAMAGMANYVGGLWYGGAGAAEASVMDINEADLRGPFRVRPRVTDDQVYNAVRGTYTETAHWTETDFPPITNATYEAQDGGQRFYKDVKLAFEIDAYRSQRLAKIDLERHRQQIVVDWPMRIRSLKLRPWNVVRLSVAKLGWTNKLFRVVGWSFNLTGGADLTLEEYAPSVYSMSVGELTTVDPAPDTALVLEPEITSVAVTETLVVAAGSVLPQAAVSWSSNSASASFRVRYRADGGEWVALPEIKGDGTEFILTGACTLTVEVTPVSFFGKPGTPVVHTKAIAGKTTAPADVASLAMSVSGGAAILTWNPSPDLDVIVGGRLWLRYSPVTSGATWDNAQDFLVSIPGTAVSTAVPLISGTFLARWVDSSGNLSENTCAVSSDIAAMLALNSVYSNDEAPSWPGTKIDMVAAAGVLSLDASLTGSYQIATVDTGAVSQIRVNAALNMLGVDLTDLIDSRTTLIDDWASFDGAVINDVGAQVWFRTTEGNPFVSPTWSAWRPLLTACDVYARGISAEIRAYSATPDHSVSISAAVLAVQAPDRTEWDNDVVSGAGACVVTFSRPFYAVPAISITAQGMASGDYYELTSKSVAGFTVHFKNSAVSISRTFDWAARSF